LWPACGAEPGGPHCMVLGIVLYIAAAVTTAFQAYAGIQRELWWAPSSPLPLLALIGCGVMLLGAAWGAVRATSSSWVVLIGAILLWAFYVPGLMTYGDHLLGVLHGGQLTLLDVNYLQPLGPALLLAAATLYALYRGPLATRYD
jgi:hypothetical protein